MERVIAVTPAGRRGYLELLSHYILADPTICEWHLWDNCRQPADRQYINGLQDQHPKIKVLTLPGVDGTNYSVNRFYGFCNEKDTLYIKMDDDLVYLPPNFGLTFLEKVKVDRGRKLWWSPLVINNAICTWLIKYFSKIHIAADVSAQASCPIGWRSGKFAESLHAAFIDSLRSGKTETFIVPDRDVMLSRFSINCIGFFGSDVIEAGANFCPLGVDDEEWLSAVLPAKLNRPGKIIGDSIVAHFGFYTQEVSLLKTHILDDYYGIAGLNLTDRPVRKVTSRSLIKAMVLERLSVLPFPNSVSGPVDAAE